MKYYDYSVNLLRDRVTTNPNELQEPAKDYAILKALGVKDFNRGIDHRKSGFRDIKELATSFNTLKDMLSFFGYLKRVDKHGNRSDTEKDYGVSYCVKFASYLPRCSEISLSKEQPVFLLSTWVQACLNLNKTHINEHFEYNVLRPLREALATKPEDLHKITEPEGSDYIDPRGKLFRAIKCVDDEDIEKFNYLVYKVMIPSIQKDGLVNFILNIDPNLYEEDNLYADNLYTQAVISSIFMSLHENLDLFTKMVITKFLSTRLDMYSTPTDKIVKEHEYVSLANYIRECFFLEKYFSLSVPIYEDFRFYLGHYGDFMILLGHIK